MEALISCNRILKLMGNRFEFTVLAHDDDQGQHAIDQTINEVIRIEELLSTFKETSETNQINKYAGIAAVKVSREIIELIERCNKISEITQGAFDITYGSIDKSLWNFDVNMTSLPDASVALETVRLINYKNVIIHKENCTVMLKHSGMRIGFGAIGKGYAADMAKKVLQKHGINNGIVNAAGDLITWGTFNGRPWIVGIADPNQKLHAFSTLNITNMAIATSGSYEKYATINGKKYAHTIDPKTGIPVHGIKSVSIICPSAELADALSTPVTVLGKNVGLNLINQLNQVACIIIDEHDSLHTSNNITLKN
ncbi:MAG: FAD:protein FMN transferase [Phormidesmis sp. FL-bin-119]|nr:FAD:protein FMN transferase [Pedobacter sp.]